MASDSVPLRFATFDVSRQVFLQQTFTLGIVNLKPIVPLHVLLITRKPYQRLREVPKAELHELFDAVQDVSTVVQDLTGGTSCTVSIQDGKEAGQSVPHLHVHILPRKIGDFSPKDAVYTHLEEFGLGLHRAMQKHAQAEGQATQQEARTGTPRWAIAPDADEERRPRSGQEMAREAAWLREKIRAFVQ